MAIKKIIHIADVHIRNFQRLEEYTHQLNELKEKIIFDSTCNIN